MNVVEATFLYENSRRFTGKVLVNGKEELCYIASSSHLKNIINLEKREVLLIPIKSKKSLLQYALYAVLINDEYVIVNTNISNQVIRNSLQSNLLNCLGTRDSSRNEIQIEGYKTDIFLEENNTIIEIKSLISLEEEALFPIMYSSRFDQQLIKIESLLDKYVVWLLIVSFGKQTSKIYFDTKSKNWLQLSKCLEKGLKVKAINCILNKDFEPQITDKIIEIDNIRYY